MGVSGQARVSQNLSRRCCAKIILVTGLLGPILLHSTEGNAQAEDMLIDDFSDPGLTSKLGSVWRGVSDQVMGGISQASVTREVIEERNALRLKGDVRLENDGGFIQAALDLSPDRGVYDASGFTGLRLTVRGNGERYSLHLRSTDNVRPWQSYRAHFTAGPEWEAIELPFASFTPYRLETALDTSRLRRIGLVAIGRAFSADLAVSELAFYR